ncbi:urokinase plasminogen activator surface receptor [Rhinophrynus dorsalis]
MMGKGNRSIEHYDQEEDTGPVGSKMEKLGKDNCLTVLRGRSWAEEDTGAVMVLQANNGRYQDNEAQIQAVSRNDAVECYNFHRTPASTKQGWKAWGPPALEDYSSIIPSQPKIASLQCYHFRGPPDHALEKQIAKTCESNRPFCSSTLFTYSGFLHGNVLVKGCSEGQDDFCNKTQTSPLKSIEAKEIKLCCNTEQCNKDLVPDLGKDSQKWGIECLACNGDPTLCKGHNLPSVQCEPSQTNCIQVSITTALSLDTHKTIMKGCSNSSTCPGLSAFSNGEKLVSYASKHQCCNRTYCNTGSFTDTEAGTENGLECYSRSTPKVASKMRCRGEMNQCMDLIGTSPHEVVMSGCATEAFCQGLYPQFQIPGWKRTVCCTGALCNNGNITESQN